MGHVNLAQVVCDRSTLRPNEDVAVITMHWRAGIGGNFDGGVSMDDGRRDSAAAKISTFLNVVKSYQASSAHWTHIYWYEAAYVPGTPRPRIDEHPLTINGSSSGPLPPQVACSVTFRTAVRKNWGRFYLPELAIMVLAPDGSFSTATVNAICDAAKALTDRGPTIDETLAVWSPTEQTHHDPQQVVVDDVPDVIRSRRFSSTIYRRVNSAG